PGAPGEPSTVPRALGLGSSSATASRPDRRRLCHVASASPAASPARDSSEPGVRLKTREQGAARLVLPATSPLLEGIGGRYFEDCNEAQIVDERGAPSPAWLPTRSTRRTPTGERDHAADARLEAKALTPASRLSRASGQRAGRRGT